MRRYIRSDHVVKPVHCCQAVDTSCWCLSRFVFVFSLHPNEGVIRTGSGRGGALRKRVWLHLRGKSPLPRPCQKGQGPVLSPTSPMGCSGPCRGVSGWGWVWTISEPGELKGLQRLFFGMKMSICLQKNPVISFKGL